jgi:hypothetical protein
MQNECVFSADRRYRYILKHTWEPFFDPKLCTWIGANPSVAEEASLDASTKRIRAFSSSWGYKGFIMTNLFALVSTDPKGLYSVEDPVGPENDRYILQAVQETMVVIAALVPGRDVEDSITLWLLRERGPTSTAEAQMSQDIRRMSK